MKNSLATVILISASIIGCSSIQSNPPKSTFVKTAAKTHKKTHRKIASLGGQISNSVRYRERGAKPEVGLAGGHSIQTWGLMDKNLLSTIYVTTGDLNLESTEEGTSITRVQIKGIDASTGEAIFNEVQNSLVNNGSFQFTTDQLARHQPIEVKANVSKEGEKRDFVVSTNNKVYLLPDLKAVKMENQQQAFVNQIVEITGEISEVNWDLGATADCVLAVDGIEAQRAPQIWVDTADSVICRFEQAFETVGVKELSIRVENVKPTDYDLSNNTVLGEIEILNDILPIIPNTIVFSDLNHKYYQKSSGFWGQISTYSFDHDYRNIQYFGNISEPMAPNVPWAMQVVLTSGGTSATYEKNLTNCYTNGNYKQCIDYDYDTATSMYVTSYGEYNYTSVLFNNYYSKIVYNGSAGYYTEGSQNGLVTGDDFGISIAVKTGEVSYVDERVGLPLPPHNQSEIQPWTCEQHRWGQYCWEESSITTGKQYWDDGQ